MRKSEAARVKVGDYVWCKNEPGVQFLVTAIVREDPRPGVRTPLFKLAGERFVSYRVCERVED